MDQAATGAVAAATTVVEDHAAAAATAGAPPSKRQRIPIAFTHDYEELSILGAGSFGVVTKARHRITGETVAIKRHRSTDGHPYNGDLLREARFLDACGGGIPFLVGYRGLARDLTATGDLCLLMEYGGAATLRDYLRERRRHPPLPEATVRAAMWQLLTGCRMMHDRAHVVHRDIKPGNILVGDDHRTVKIGDLGLAMYTTDPPPHARAGTVAYMAPEVLLEKGDYDARVDTWSLGCVMAELVGGRPLFESGGDDEVAQLWTIYEVCDDDGGRLREMFPEETLSGDGFEVLSGLLAFDAGDRLTAEDALWLPWFDKVGALALPREGEVVVAAPTAVHEKKRLPAIIQPPLPKKPKVF